MLLSGSGTIRSLPFYCNVLSVYVAQHLHDIGEDNTKYCNQSFHKAGQLTRVSCSYTYNRLCVDVKLVHRYTYLIVPKTFKAVVKFSSGDIHSSYKIQQQLTLEDNLTLDLMVTVLLCCQQAFSCCICPCSFVF